MLFLSGAQARLAELCHPVSVGASFTFTAEDGTPRSIEAASLEAAGTRAEAVVAFGEEQQVTACCQGGIAHKRIAICMTMHQGIDCGFAHLTYRIPQPWWTSILYSGCHAKCEQMLCRYEMVCMHVFI